jgi:hypothetical protein
MKTGTNTNRIRIRHFYKTRFFFKENEQWVTGKGKLVASIATQENADGTIAIAVARCNKSDSPNRKEGRRLAEERLWRFQQWKRGGLYGIIQEVAESDASRSLVMDVSRNELINLIRTTGLSIWEK